MNKLLDLIIKRLKPVFFRYMFFSRDDLFLKFKFKVMYLFSVIGLYEKSTFNYLKNKNIKCFVDVGANSGLFYKMIQRSDLNYFAFEPNLECMKYLKKLFQNNSNVYLFQIALGEINKKNVSFYVPQIQKGFYEPALGSLERVNSEDRKMKVNLSTLDSILPIEIKKSVDIIKIDTEGGELNVLKGSKETIKISCCEIIIEYHPSYSQELKKYLKEINYKAVRIDNGDSLYLDEITSTCNILLLPIK